MAKPSQGRRRPDLRSTTERGLGADHQRKRREALAKLRDGDPCARCLARGVYHPLYRAMPASLLDLDDFPPRSVALRMGITPVKALSHRRCNRRHGAKITNTIKAIKADRPQTYDRW